ncbi:zinc metalloprotease HtpX [Candidatus Dependentiae bacterium]|nr:zinc metalloprotease HtpX [Candidatus Dependentiae bacterium]
MFLNQLKTAFLLGSLSGLLLLLGHLFGGQAGLTIALTIAIVMNFFMYFYSDKLVLRMYKAQPLDQERFSHVHDMVEELCSNANMPMPKIWYIPTSMANAFATGRNPKNASIAVTQGIIDLLDNHELRGVIAHELSHVKNRDILVATIAATLAMTIGYLADMLYWSTIFGGRRDREQGGTASALLVAILMPFAAMLIQLAISRSREYLADESGATISHDPLALASALEKLQYGAQMQKLKPKSQAQTSTASLFIVYPFFGKGLFNLFSTHPPMEKRIKRLRNMAR